MDELPPWSVTRQLQRLALGAEPLENLNLLDEPKEGTMTTTATASKLVPMGDRLIVERDDAPTETPGGLVLPDTAKERPKVGTVVSVGVGTFNPESSTWRPICTGPEGDGHGLGPGDRVLFGAYAGTEVDHDGRKLLILREEDVLAVVEE